MPFDWFETRIYLSAIMALLQATQCLTPLFDLRRPLRVLGAFLWIHWHAQRILLDSRKFYIGSTTTSVHSRKDARIRKLRLLQQGQFTNTEVMVHYFHTHSDFYGSLTLPLQK